MVYHSILEEVGVPSRDELTIALTKFKLRVPYLRRPTVLVLEEKNVEVLIMCSRGHRVL